MKALLVHPGTQHAFQLARQLEKHDSLTRFWTGFAWDPDSVLGRQVGFLPDWARRRLAGRRLEGLPREKLRTRPLTDLRALHQLRSGLDEQMVMLDRNEAFQRMVPNSELISSDIVIGFDTASWLLAGQASSVGRSFVLDRTTGHHLSFEQLLPRLGEQFPEWMDVGARRLPRLTAAEEVEHSEAKRIVVGSSFARRTLIENGVPAEKVDVAPLGVDVKMFTPKRNYGSVGPIRFVFVGRLSAAKGLPLLLQVWRSLGKVPAELWLVGSVDDRRAALIPDLAGLTVRGKVSRRELPGVLRQCDVLVFPSYFEGFGAVLLEAMATGLPVIATDATGAPDVITNGVEGYIIPAGDAAALRDAMQKFIDSPDLFSTMSPHCRDAAERHSWDHFGARWLEILQPLCNGAQVVRGPGGAGLVECAPVTILQGAKTKAVLVHPGTQYSFRLAAELERHGCLNRFWTGIAYVPDSRLGALIQHLPERLRRQLSNRRLDGVPPHRICTRPYGEWRAVQRLRAGHDDQTVMFERNARFQRNIPNSEIAESDVVIGFDTSAWLLAEKASSLGRRFILDRSIGHALSFERLVPALRERFPEWVENFPPRLPNLLHAEAEEHRLADRIVVPSSFTRGTLIENGVPEDKIIVIPFGVDLGAFRPSPRPNRARPLRFVFLGTVGVRKGVPLLLEAWRHLAHSGAELWLAGTVSEKHAHLVPRLPGLRLIGKVPHKGIPALLNQCDVLVFPSYFEGLAQVQLEALACGLPIIATQASGATELITNGAQGYIVPVGDVEALQEAMGNFIASPDELARMSPAARVCAERFSWEAYGNRWTDLLQS